MVFIELQQELPFPKHLTESRNGMGEGKKRKRDLIGIATAIY